MLGGWASIAVLSLLAAVPITGCARTGLGLSLADERAASGGGAVADRPGSAGAGGVRSGGGGEGTGARGGAPSFGASGAAAGATAVACDRDGDGYESSVCGGDDCQDDDARIHPGAWDTNATIGAWRTEYVFGDIPGDTRSNVSIAVDLAGVVHISEGQVGLRYATNVSGAWVAENVDSASTSTPSLALGAEGAPYIAYNTPSEVRVATRGALGWSTARVLTLNPRPAPFLGFSALALDHAGRLHLVYSSEGVLQYATDHGNGTWQVEASFSASEDQKPALALDSQDVPHFVFEGTDHGAALLYATRCGAAFCVSPVASGLTLAADIALDASNGVHVVHAGGTQPSQLVHSTRQVSGSWSAEPVALTTSWSVGLRAGLAGSPQSLHLAFTRDDDSVIYASRESSGWMTQRVAYSANRVSLALEAAGIIHIAYTAFRFDVNSYVGYATNRELAPDGIDQNCDGVDGVDGDRDGQASLGTGGPDCDDRDAAIGVCVKSR